MTTTTVKRAYKYRFYPDTQQRELLLRTFGCVRLVYNKALEERTRAWRLHGTSLSYSDTSAMLTQWKKTEDLAFLNEVSSVPLQQTLRHLQSGFQKFWNKQNNYPRFKSRKRSRLSAEFTASGFRWNAERSELKLAKTKNPLNIVFSRSLPDGAVISSVTISCDCADRWFVSLLVEETITHLPQLPDSAAVGVDLGVADLAVLSIGEKIAAPLYSKRDQQRLRRAQQNLSRKERGSRNAAKARRKVAKIHARIADRRRDFLHKLSTSLIRENQTIVVEDLAVRAMKARGGSCKTGLNRAISDAGLAELRSMLEYKAQWYGREVIVINRYLPTTRMCGDCAQLTGPQGRSGLSVREWTCKNCGVTHDRDVNAAQNILAAGQAVTVCGDGRSLRHATA